jgi:hypothetical protein
MRAENLRSAITRFLEETEKRVEGSKHAEDKQKMANHLSNVAAYLSNEGFVDHLAQNWHGPEQVVAIVESGDGNVRASLVKRDDAFKFSGFTDTFEREARLIMSADPNGALFQELGMIPAGLA